MTAVIAAPNVCVDKNAICGRVICGRSVGFPLFSVLDERINSEDDAHCYNER
jgi:hypothetical protein